jgi:hypothetical protein
MQNIIDKKISKLDNTFGIHYRATDHTDKKNFEEYKPFIEKFFDPNKHKTIFVSTDDQQAVNFIRDYLKKKFDIIDILCNNAIRYEGNSSIHYTSKNIKDQIKSGDDVLLDAHCLSNCDFVVGIESNVSTYAKIINKNMRLCKVDKSGILS